VSGPAAAAVPDPEQGKSTMKRVLALALIVGVISGFGLVGCGDQTGTTTTEKVSTPEGTTTTTSETKVKSTGENPPLNSAGETGKTKTP
jgi:hypothetical protein